VILKSRENRSCAAVMAIPRMVRSTGRYDERLNRAIARLVLQGAKVTLYPTLYTVALSAPTIRASHLFTEAAFLPGALASAAIVVTRTAGRCDPMSFRAPLGRMVQ
jgi:hypothetical protein